MKPITEFLVKYKDSIKVLDAINNMVDYLYEDEREHYELAVDDKEDTSNHIYNSIVVLEAFLKDMGYKKLK